CCGPLSKQFDLSSHKENQTMSTTRRTFLKGSAAFATAITAPAFLRSGRVSAQAPQYELIDLGVMDSVAVGSLTLIGSLASINLSRQVAGSQAHEGALRPAVWTLDGDITILESGEFGGGASTINERGDIGGRLRLSLDALLAS